MKNIHVLPTDKPTIIFKSEIEPFLHLYTYDARYFLTGQNIYITNDEEIKEGFVLLPNNKIVKLPKVSIAPLNNFLRGYSLSDCKKIILTTDQDLIKDGVQAIDDEFLEWFVKNPTCESVEVINFCCGQIDGKCNPQCIRKSYEIIIAKEQPKQETTLEEFAKREAKKFYDNGVSFTDLISLCAKWQQERSYSEEDLKEAFSMGRLNKTIKDFNNKFKNK